MVKGQVTLDISEVIIGCLGYFLIFSCILVSHNKERFNDERIHNEFHYLWLGEIP